MTVSTIPATYYEFAFNAAPNQAVIPPWWQDLSSRVQFGWNTDRGRQYEQDTNETGTWTPAGVANPDGALDPANASSPFAPGLTLYRGARIRCPTAPTQNLYPQIIATGSADMNVATDAVTNWWYQTRTGGSLTQVTNLTAPASGQTTALGWVTPSGTTSANGALWVGNNSANLAGPVRDCVQVISGQQYTFSYYVSRASSADATVAVTPTINWFNTTAGSSGTTAGTSTTVPVATTWARVTVTGTAPANGWARVSDAITTPVSTTATNTIYHTGYQAEQASAATAWADPGPTYFIFTGGIERLPQTWAEQDGTYGTSLLEATDAFDGLSQPTLLDPYVMEVLALGPNFLFQLNEAEGASVCVDSAGKRPAAPVETSPYGAGGVTFGSSVAAPAPAGSFLGSTGTVALFANNPGEGATAQLNETFVSIHKTTVSPGPPPNGTWTRIAHFNAGTTLPGGTNSYTVWEALPATFVASSLTGAFDFGLNASGFAIIDVVGQAGTGMTYLGSTDLCDGSWHEMAVTCDGSGNLTAYVDGVSVATDPMTLPITGITSDTIGASVQLGAGYYRGGMVGGISLITEIPAALTQAQVTNLYNSWRTASTGDTSGQRYQRVLTWVGYTGPTSIATGATQSMGPATDIAGSSALDALNSIALTENGDHFVSASGVLTFQSRSARYNQLTPVFIFGEGPPVGNAGEWPCEISQMGYDPSLLTNNVQVTQSSTSVVYTANSVASQQQYFQRTYQRTVNTSSTSEPQDAANYLLSRYQQPTTRVETITLHPSAIPGLFAVCLQLDKGVRIRVIRRPNGAPSITVDCFVEKIQWTWDPEGPDVTVQIEASPANLTAYWVQSALHTTLNAQATSGTNTATINALPDAAVNKLAQSLPSTYSLTFEPGTARQETLALAPGGIPTTSLGYATATLTFASNFAFTHAANSTVCEPLPTGQTNPALYDTASVLGPAYTTVLSGGASGTNTVTVNPLPDSKANGVASDWNAGDTIWLSPGTANFEAATILSVPAPIPGYTSAQLTLTANLAHSHTAGDYVCDPLPAGVTNPTAVAATTRIAY